jgi:ActR/RegA family two-component response regulator
VDQAHSIVFMLSDDESYELCRVVRTMSKAGLVVRLNDPVNVARFEELGAMVVEPTSATISLLDHFVRAPVATSVLLGRSVEQQMRGIELRNRGLVGVCIHDLKIPYDVIVLSVKRGDQVFSSVSYVELEYRDWLTVVGPPASLDQVAALFRAPSRYQRLVKEAPPKILLVDDEEDFVHTLSTRLETRNFEPDVAYDGEQGLAAIEAERPDVVVLDLDMPGIHGMDVLCEVRKKHHGTEVIILTGHGTDDNRRAALKLGAFSFLTKPVNINVLAKTMRSAYIKARADAAKLELGG